MINESTILLSKNSIKKLKWLAANYFVAHGEKPMPINKLLRILIDEEYNKAKPTKDITYSY
jgi:hypothetical protein